MRDFATSCGDLNGFSRSSAFSKILTIFEGSNRPALEILKELRTVSWVFRFGEGPFGLFTARVKDPKDFGSFAKVLAVFRNLDFGNFPKTFVKYQGHFLDGLIEFTKGL